VNANTPLGSGPPSTPSSPVIAATTPGQPTGVTAAIVGGATAQVSFTPPASDGFSPITGYVVRSTPATTPVDASSSPATVPGLVAGTVYTFTVSAKNVAGEGVQSAPSNSVGATPAAVSNVHAMGGDGKATVSFIPPSSTGISPIASYLVTASPGGLTG